MTAAALWTAVVASYDSAGLIELSNIRDRSATSIDTTAGENAAQAVIDLWPIYAQVTYDASDSTHVEVAKLGVIAVLWRRGGTSTTIEQVKWQEVFADDGIIAKLKLTSPRGRQGPSTNSETKRSSQILASGARPRPWSDPDSLPLSILPTPRSSNNDRER